MNVLKAAFHVVHEFPGGAAALAKLLAKKKSPTQLCHEVAPPAGSAAKLGLETAIDITEITNDDRILFAWAIERRYACVRLSVPELTNAGELLAATSRFAKETGDALIQMHKAIADGRITENEIHRFEQEVAQIAPAAISLVERMRAIATRQSRQRALPTPVPKLVQRRAAAVT